MNSRVTQLLLGIIAAAVAVIAVVMVVNLTGGEPQERKDAREELQGEAEYYCTLGGVVPGMTGLDDPAYLNCVERETESRMATWDRENPEFAWDGDD